MSSRFYCVTMALAILPAILLTPVDSHAFSAEELIEFHENDWITNGGNTYNQRYSPFDQINRYKVNELKAKWVSAMGAVIYANELVTEEGVWKFKSTHAFNTWTAGYKGGWKEASDTPRVTGPSEKYPPDLPPTTEFLMFPNVYSIPFHY